MSEVIIHTDGGARGNPGPAAIGVVIERKDEPTHKIQAYIGNTTNNQAEYQAIRRALETVAALPEVTSVRCYLDSELVVRQLNGQYKVKEPSLKPHHQAILEKADELGCPVSFEHVLRAKNAEADALVNAALDAEMSGQTITQAEG